MEKLPMCRICLMKNVRMYVVVNKNLHELYEKLTNVPFVTKDRRPMLTCFFCCTKLKQCCRFLRKCLEAEEMFTQMMNEDCETDPIINPKHLEFFNEFVNSPIEHISIDDGGQTERVAIKEELPAEWERHDNIVDPEEEHPIDELELKNSDVKDTPAHHSESDSEDLPLMEIKTKVEDEQEYIESELENVDNSYYLKDTPAFHSESDSEDDEPVMEIKIEVEDEQEPIGAPVANKRKLDSRRRKPEDTRTTEQKKQEINRKVLFISKSILKTQNRTSKLVTKFKQPLSHIKPRVNTTLVTSNRDNSKNNDIRGTISNKGSDDINEHRREKPFKCDICQSSFTQKINLKRHILIHTGEQPFKCDVCQRSFTRKGYLTRHIRTHIGEKPFKCDICQRSSSQKSDLIKHIRTHTSEKSFKCDACPRSFKQKQYLRRHIRTHTGEKSFYCDICQRSFKQKAYLSNHIQIHNTLLAKKVFKCDICQRSYTNYGNLTRHIRVHTGLKPFKCDICPRSFYQKSEVILHIRTHTGEKPFKCDICQKSFSQTVNLKKHIYIHADEKPFKCDVCQRGFAQKVNLTRHIRTHTGEKPLNL